MAEVTPVSAADFERWMNKAVEWGQATTVESQKDVCLHLPKLQEFLLQIYETLKHMVPNAAIQRFPMLGQLLGRLCWNPFVIGHEDTRKALMCCLCCLHSSDPTSALELKANKWIQNLLCHLFSTSELGHHKEQRIVDTLGCTTADYYGKLLKNIMSSLIKQLGRNQISEFNSTGKCCTDHVRFISVLCIPILALPDVAPLLEELLAYNRPEPKEALDDHFLESLNNALLSKKIVLSESAVLSLWLRHLPSLEKAALDLFQRLIGIPSKSLREMEHIIKDSFLPQDSCHPAIFRIVDDIFRNALLESDGNIKVITIIRLFTHRFIQVYQKDNLQRRFPLRAFFPHSNLALVMALLRHPLGLPPNVCLQHLKSIVKQIKSVDQDKRSHGNVFESWFLLIHFGDWVDIAAEQLLTSEYETSDDLLWLLAFYYNPCNENQERTRTMVEGRALYDDLIKLHSKTSITSLDLREILEDGKRASKWHPSTLPLVRHLCITFLLYSAESHFIIKEFITYMTQTEEAANEVSDVLARTVCRLNIPGMRNEKIIKIAHELL